MRRAAAVLVAMAIAIAVAPAASSETAPSARRALLVGVDDYAGGTRDNVGAVGDVSDLRAYLVDRAGFRAEDVRILTDRAATAQAIRDGLRWLGDASSDTSLSVFHFSGHVQQAAVADGDGEAVDEQLWAADNRFVPDGELAQWIRRIRGRSWTDISGCEAAGFDDGLSGPTRLFTASSLEHEKSFEHPGWHNSIFTGLLADLGMLQKHADADGNARVSIQEAFRYAEREAPRMTARQSPGPQHPLLAGGDGTEWFLSLPKPAPATSGEPRRCLVIFTCDD